MREAYPRAQAPRRATWNREAVFADWDEFAAELTDLEGRHEALAEFPGTLADSPTRLLAWLELYSEVANRLGRILTFVQMSISVDSADTSAKARFGQAMKVASAISGATAFAEPELIAAMEPDSISLWVDREPRLAPYESYLKALLRKAPHTLSGEVETVLGNLGGALSATSRTLNELASSDLKFDDATDSDGTAHPVGQGTFMDHYTRADSELRRTTWESFNDRYLQFQNTFAAGYLGVIEQNVFETRERGYESVLHRRLEPTGLPVSVFHTLIDTFIEHLPVWHRYWDVKRRLLGLDEIRPWDRWAPLTDGGPELTYVEAVEWIATALKPMGEEYVNTLRTGATEDRWVDWAPNAGKRQGAFSVPAYPGSFPFVMMTFNDSVFSMSTLAHELGHSMHHSLIARNQPAVYNGIAAIWRSSSVAETASNFHQAMTRTWLKQTRGDDESLMLAVIDEAMTNYHRYCFIMPTLARFELEVTRRAEAGEPLNAPILGEIMSGFFDEGYGDTMTDDPERSAITWAQFQHLYRPFYTFQYAIGISAASIAADRIQADEDHAVEKYLDMLKAGYSKPAIDIFKIAEIDMTTPEPMRAMFGRLDDLVSLLEARVG